MIDLNAAVFELSAGNFKGLPVSDLPEIAFSGRSNVGKSTLINKVVNRKSLARVSAKPGKTATINFYRIGDARLADMPGYGYAKTSFAEKKRYSGLVERYFNSDRKIALTIQIVDFRRPPSALDFEMMDFLYFYKVPFAVVGTKADKLNKTEKSRREIESLEELEKYEGVERIAFSSISGEGLDRVREFIVRSCEEKLAKAD